MADQDDERFEHARWRMRDLARRYEQQAIAEMEQTLAETPDPSIADGVPAPLECHPYYRDRHPLIKDWLDGKNFGGYSLQLPVAPVVRSIIDPGPPPWELSSSRDRVTLRKQRAAGLAPYVGDPFVYTWNVAVDDYGRMACGESSITYLDG